MPHRPFLRFDRFGAAAVLAVALALAALHALADVRFASGQLKVAGHSLKVEIATTEEQRSQGLMFRRSLGPDDGMLFVFDSPGYYAMWMKNTLIPLSVAFVDEHGVILNILDMEPQTLDSHAAAGPALYAIETNRGWFAARKVKAGDKVTGIARKAAG